MIIIFSVTKDITTNEISNWLDYYDHPHRVIYAEDIIFNLKLEHFSTKSLHTFLETIFECSMNDISAFWCRKWNFNPVHTNTKKPDVGIELVERFKHTTQHELKIFYEFMFNSLPQNKVINQFYNPLISKLHQLILAQECDFLIPETHLTSTKSHLEDLIGSADSFVTKAMYEGIVFNYEDATHSTFTSRIKTEQVTTEHFIPSMIQKEVRKKYEIRAFVVGEKIFAMAIFSQGNKQTEVDYRQCDQVNPNKRAPYELPEMIKSKIKQLMQRMNIQTGSFDFIVDLEDNYYFLEVNPYGQFAMVSKPNNYNIEHEFAQYLISYERNQ